MRKKIVLILLTLSMIALSGCAQLESLLGEQPAETVSQSPMRMITAMEIAAFPEDEAMSRSYTDTDTLTSILRMIQNMDTNDVPEEEPQLGGLTTYLTMTVTYTDNSKESYYLAEKQFLRHRNGSWCIVDPLKGDALIQFIQNTPSN